MVQNPGKPWFSGVLLYLNVWFPLIERRTAAWNSFSPWKRRFQGLFTQIRSAQVKAIEAHQGQGHQPGSDQVDGQTLKASGTAGQADLPAQAGKAHHGHCGPGAAEQGIEKRSAWTVPPLGDEQRRAHRRAVGGNRG